MQIVYDDARHFILTTKEKFDVITSDPIHPWVKGAATLYTKEYFELVKQHLNPGGVVTQWVPLYESAPAMVKSEVATFFNVFPDGTVWSNDIQGEATTSCWRVTRRRRRSTRCDAERVSRAGERARSRIAGRSRLRLAASLLTTYGGQARDLAPWLADAEINRDSNLRLQYLAGMGLEHVSRTRASMMRCSSTASFRRICSSVHQPCANVLRQTLNGPSGP